MSKLEALFEGETLVERDNFDEGVDICTQRPALRRLRGSLLQKRTDGNVRSFYSFHIVLLIGFECTSEGFHTIY